MHNHVREIYQPLSLKAYRFFFGIAHRASGAGISVRVSSVVELDRVVYPFGAMINPQCVAAL